MEKIFELKEDLANLTNKYSSMGYNEFAFIFSLVKATIEQDTLDDFNELIELLGKFVEEKRKKFYKEN